MTPLTQLPAGAWRGVAGVFTDIDDTLTTSGAITLDALRALSALEAAGLPVIAVTGRPVGWSEPFALGWPVRAIVAENGAVLLTRTAAGASPGQPGAVEEKGVRPASGGRNQLQKTYQQDAETRRRNFGRLQDAAARVLREVRGATLARDSAGRETDIAIDHSEFMRLSERRIGEVVRILREEGLHATVSSIHVNGWIGEHDKWQGACWAARELLGIDLPAEAARWVYVGDSTNDQKMFQHFPQSVGVANIERFVPQLEHLPRWVTAGARGAGFAEVAARLLADRSSA